MNIINEPTIFAEPIFKIGNFVVTNSLINAWIVVLILVILAIILRIKLKQKPGMLQNVFESIIEMMFSLADQITNNRKLSMRILPIALTAFMFILLNNWLGLLPGIGSIGQVVLHDGQKIFIPYLRGGTADINTTLALSFLSVLGANIFGIISIGIWKTFNKYVNVKVLTQMVIRVRKDPQILIVAPITFFVGLLEIIGEIAKVASLSFRLFGNVFAGEVLLSSMAALFAFGLPIPFLFLEILVGLIQALIFSMLTMVYFTIATHDHEDSNDDGVIEEPHIELVEREVMAEGKMTQ